MTTFNKAYGFVEHRAHGVHDFSSDQLVVALSNTAPGSESTNPTVLTANCILGNVTQISYTNCSSRNITTSGSAQSGGTYKLTLADLPLSASGGAVWPFRYVYIYNDTPTSPAAPILGYSDYGSAITLSDGESFTLDFSDANGLLQDT